MTVVAPSTSVNIRVEVACLAIKARSARNPSRRVVHEAEHEENDDKLKHCLKTLINR